jgi:FdhE protein
MTDPLSPEQAVGRVEKAVRRMSEEIPQLANIFQAFSRLMAEQAGIKAELSASDLSYLEIDPERYTQGVPLLTKEKFVVPLNEFRQAADRLLPLMEKSFPNIQDQIRVFHHAINEESPESEALATSVISGSSEDIQEAAKKLGMDLGVLQFAVGLIIKPFAERISASIPVLPEDLQWHKGYCPVCGSWPELSFLEGTEGRRRLRCSFCSHEWSFMRIQCPFCETDDQEKLELLFQEGREHERAEMCHECMKYVVGIDPRDRIEEVVREVAALGMVYLDMLAQEKGFKPGAICGWNLVGGA